MIENENINLLGFDGAYHNKNVTGRERLRPIRRLRHQIVSLPLFHVHLKDQLLIFPPHPHPDSLDAASSRRRGNWRARGRERESGREL